MAGMCAVATQQHEKNQETRLKVVDARRPPPTRQLDNIVGHYDFAPSDTLLLGAKMMIWREGESIRQAWGENVGLGAYKIYPESETNFFLKINGAQLTFIKNDKREVTAVIHHMEGWPDVEGRKVAEPAQGASQFLRGSP